MYKPDNGHEVSYFDISTACEESICRLVQQRTGISIQDHQLKKLHQILNNACQHFSYPNPNAYLRALQADNTQSAEFEYLIAGITVGESYFFRDELQMSFIRDTYLPQLIQERRETGDLTLRIWSAGCAAGQELYSMAIMLHELLPDIADWNLRLLGTDINTDALALAMKARYSKWSLRAINEWQKKRYFSKAQNDFDLDSQIRDMCRFIYLNLSDDSYPSILNDTHTIDLILCRNVLIYFQREEIDSVLEKMRDCLRDDCLRDNGILMLGAADTFDFSIPELTLHNRGHVHYYRKAITDTYNLSQFVLSETGDVEALWRDDQEHEPVKVAAVTAEKQVLDAEAAIELIRQGEWQTLIDTTMIVDVSDNALLSQYRAKALANLGRLDEAAECCQQAISLDSTDKHSYFIYGLVLQELEQIPEAEQAFKRALYLDQFFVEAQYTLGTLLIRSGQLKAGMKALENALHEVEQGDPDRIIHDTSGVTYAKFAQILQNEISMYRELLPANL